MSTTPKLLIVESSSKCSIIESYLGPNYKCISCNGHIRHILDLKSINVKNNFDTTYSIVKEKKAHVSKMSKIVSRYSKENIILATDNDREGEAIAWHICEVFELPISTTQRIVFNEVTRSALLKAVETPHILDMNLVKAQQARQVLDFIVGFTISPLLWKQIGSGSSAGRCQTPALRLVYDNEKENEKAKEKEGIHWSIQACVFSQNLMFDLNKTFDTEKEVHEFLSLSITHKHTLTVYPPKLSERSPPKPFNTSALLQAASHIGAKETMACCQTLYQLGHITYMRTENRKYAPSFINIVSTYIEGNWSKKHVNPKLLEMHGNQDSNNPHEAIRVTNLNMRDLIVKDNPHAETVYKLIWQNTVKSCMAPAVFNTLPMEILAPNDCLYKHTIETPKFKGFMEDDDHDINLDIFTSMSMRRFQPSTIVNYNYIQSIAKVRQKHSRYTEASLIHQMEDLGIGRPSTFSLLVDVIQSRKYVDKKHIVGTQVECVEHFLSTSVTEKRITKTFGNEQNKLVINRVGNTTIEFLTKHFDNLFSYNYTKQMEERLDLIAAGKEVWHTVCDDCYKEIKRQKKTIEIIAPVPVIRVLGTWEDHEVRLKSGAYGNYLEYNETTISLTDVKKEFSEIVLEDVVSSLENKNIILTLTPSLSIRTSKYGPYIFYKTDKMKKPKFFDLKGKDPKSDDLLEWVTNTYLNNNKKKI